MSMEAINPATGETIQSYDEMRPEEVQQTIEAAHQAFLAWRETSFAQRARALNQAAILLRERTSALAHLMTAEMGKVLREAEGEVKKCAWVCDYYAEHAASFLEDLPIETDAQKSFVSFQPLGVVLAVMPWNFPLWQVFRFAAPALMAGNVGLLKHASNVPGCALAIEEILRDAGFPHNAFRTLLVGSAQVGTILEHPLVRAATLTGSTPAGRAVAAKAGEMIKKTVLELGGSDPYVILEDADIDLAVEKCVTSRLLNAGQSCIAAKRFIVVEACRQEFERKFVEKMKATRAGDPLEEGTDIGPLARRDLRDELHEQVQQSIAQGADCLLGGHIPQGKGAFYPPTVLSGVKKGMSAYEEELFGPVAAIIPVKDEEEALEVANDSVFGLGAAVFTRDQTRGEKIAATRLDVGCCFVNDFVRSDPRLPFGGVKESGYGRELALFGIREFVNIKTVYIP